MITIIIATLALALFQTWLLPATIDIRNTKYKITSRDKPPAQSVLLQRIDRAGQNLHASLPAFLALAILCVIQHVDVTQVALAWLILRVIYLPCYMFDFTYLRSTSWVLSIGCLIYMAVSLYPSN